VTLKLLDFYVNPTDFVFTKLTVMDLLLDQFGAITNIFRWRAISGFFLEKTIAETSCCKNHLFHCHYRTCLSGSFYEASCEEIFFETLVSRAGKYVVKHYDG
jgi:hypothetical protein